MLSDYKINHERSVYTIVDLLSNAGGLFASIIGIVTWIIADYERFKTELGTAKALFPDDFKELVSGTNEF